VPGRPDKEGTAQAPEAVNLVVDTAPGKTPEPQDSLRTNEKTPPGRTGIENHEGTIAVISTYGTWKAGVDSCLCTSESVMGESVGMGESTSSSAGTDSTT
jgi:hypothetical protein